MSLVEKYKSIHGYRDYGVTSPSQTFTSLTSGLVPGVPGADPIRLVICTMYTLRSVNATIKLGHKVKRQLVNLQAINPETAKRNSSLST
jgi:hypothetical protein